MSEPPDISAVSDADADSKPVDAPVIVKLPAIPATSIFTSQERCTDVGSVDEVVAQVGNSSCPAALMQGSGGMTQKLNKWGMAKNKLSVSKQFKQLNQELNEDSERTRILKEVAKSANVQGALRRFNSQNYCSQRRIALEEPEEELSTPKRSGRVRSPMPARSPRSKGMTRAGRIGSQSTPSLPSLAFEESVCRDLPECDDLTQMLSEAGRRIETAKERRRAGEEQRIKARRRAGDWSWPPNPDVQISTAHLTGSKRPQSEGERRDAAVMRFICDTSSYKELETMTQLIGDSNGFPALRKTFDRHFEYHPRMPLLNDLILQDPREFDKALEGDVPSSQASGETDFKSRDRVRQARSMWVAPNSSTHKVLQKSLTAAMG